MSRIINACLYNLFDEKLDTNIALYSLDVKIALYPMFMSIYHMPEKVQLVKSLYANAYSHLQAMYKLSLNETLAITIVLYSMFVLIYIIVQEKKYTR